MTTDFRVFKTVPRMCDKSSNEAQQRARSASPLQNGSKSCKSSKISSVAVPPGKCAGPTSESYLSGAQVSESTDARGKKSTKRTETCASVPESGLLSDVSQNEVPKPHVRPSVAADSDRQIPVRRETRSSTPVNRVALPKSNDNFMPVPIKKEIRLKMLVQQCVSASLQLTDNEGSPCEVGVDRGMVVYVCFLKDCKLDLVEQAVKTLFKVKLCETTVGTMVSIQDINGDILIIPQATLGGKVKCDRVQYHCNISKEEGLQLYAAFVQICRNNVDKTSKSKIACGVYGERQILTMSTNGPFSHLLEF